MYTAKIVGKTEELGRLVIDVEFTDGTKTLVERISPDTKEQFNSWVAGRLYSLNSVAELKTETSVNDVLDPSAVTPPSAEELAFTTWKRKLGRLHAIKTMLIDTGVLTGNEPKVVALRDDLKATLLPAYIDQL